MDEAYLERAHARPVHGFVDTCTRDFDQTWPDYRHEVGLRHHRARKSQADGAHGVVPHIPYRWIVAFLYPFTQVVRPILETAEVSPQDADAMLQAWTKSFTLQVTSTAAPTSPRVTGSVTGGGRPGRQASGP